jgi:hypothetical protein
MRCPKRCFVRRVLFATGPPTRSWWAVRTVVAMVLMTRVVDVATDDGFGWRRFVGRPRRYNIQSMLPHFASNLSGPNCWAQPDMLEVGNTDPPNGAASRAPVLTAAESRTHFGLWCITSAPLILGFDVREAVGRKACTNVRRQANVHMCHAGTHVWSQPPRFGDAVHLGSFVCCVQADDADNGARSQRQAIFCAGGSFGALGCSCSLAGAQRLHAGCRVGRRVQHGGHRCEPGVFLCARFAPCAAAQK